MNIQNLEMHNFKDYKVNLSKITKVLNVLIECVDILDKNFIKYRLTGSLALILNTKKFYRSIKDIDFLIDDPFSIEQINLLKREGFIYSNMHPKRFVFHKSSIIIEFHVSYKFHNDFHITNLNGKLIEIMTNDSIFDAKKDLYTDRKKDADDMEFYNKFV